MTIATLRIDMPNMRRLFCLCMLHCIGSASAFAELPSIRFDRLHPMGASAGTSVEVEVQGSDIEDLMGLVFDQPGLSAEAIADKPNWFRIHVAGDVPVGTYDVYLSGRFGVSNPRLFAVTRGLVDVLDNGANQSPETAQTVEIGSAVNGVADGNAEDCYRFTAAAGKRVTIDCQAQRLDSQLDGVMTLTAYDGRILASSSDYYGRDPFIDFSAPADGEYVVSVHDLSYRGGQPYRLTISDQPQIESVFPAAVQAGATVELTAFGRNLTPLGGAAGSEMESGLPLDQWRFPFTAAGDVLDLKEYRFRDHPTHHSVLPTAATCSLTGLQVAAPGVESLWSYPPVLVTTHAVQIEQEPNDAADQATSYSTPLIIAGRFDSPQDADWFELTVPTSGNYLFNVYCERIAGRADPYVAIIDGSGNRMTEFDDYGHRVNAFDGHLRDPSQEVGLQAEQTYKVLVQDRYGRGGPRYRYVLEVAATERDFHAAVIHRSNPNPGGTTVFKGAATYLDVVIHHRGNSAGEITITAENLPVGLHVAPTTINNDTRGTLVMWADEDAADWTGPIRLIATAEFEGGTMQRLVRPYSRVANNDGTSQVSRSLMVAIRERAPFDLRIEPAEIEVVGGQPANLTLHIHRIWEGATNPITVQAHQFPGGFQLGNFDVAADASSVPFAIDVQQTRPGRYTLTVLGQSQVPFNKDAAATERPNMLVATPARPVTIIVKSTEQ